MPDELEKIELKAAALAARPDVLIGQTLENKILIEQFAAKGGMGAVYRAKHLQLGTKVAVKVLSASFDEQAINRFRQEALVAFKLRHPNVCSVHDVGVTPDDRAFLVMDWLEGESLANVIAQEGALSANRAVSLALQICEGLSEAHKNGIVHRDIKPSNIFITKDGYRELARIIDFGIAKSLSSDHGSTMTATGEVLGSPAYMSPEQASGNRADQRSDIYSLGCVLFEMLTGQTAFKGDNPLQVLMKHANEPAPTLASAAGKAFPKQIEAIVAHALQKDPDKRYQSVEQLEEDLKRLQKGSILAHAKAKPRVTTRTAIISLSLIALLAGAGGAALYFSMQSKEDPPLYSLKERAEFDKHSDEVIVADREGAAFEQLSDEAKSVRAPALSKLCDDLLLRLSSAGMHSAPYLRVLGWKADAMKFIDKRKAISLYNQMRDLSSKDSYFESLSNEQLGYLSKDNNDWNGATEYYLAALKFYEPRQRTQPLQYSRLCEHLGVTYQTIGKYDEAIRWFQKAFDIDSKNGGTANIEFAYDATGLSECYAKKGDPKTAAAYAEKACIGYHEQKQLENEKHELTELRDLYAQCSDHENLKKTDERITQFNLQIDRQLEELKQLSATAATTWSATDARPAILKYQELMSLIKARYKGDPKYAEYMQDYGKLLRIAGLCQRAQVILQEVIGIQSKDYGADSEVTASAVEELGLAFLFGGEYQQAEQQLKRAIMIYSTSRGADSPEVARCMMQLGNALNAQKKPKEALVWFERSIPYSQAHKTNAAAYDFEGMANSYKLMDRLNEAIAYQRKAVDEFAKLKIPAEQNLALGTLMELCNAAGDKQGLAAARAEMEKLDAAK